MSHKIWYHEAQKERGLAEIYKQQECLFCGHVLIQDRKAEEELRYGYGYDVIAPAIGYAGVYTGASVGICQICGWWKYTQWMNFPAPSGEQEFFSGGYGVLRELDLADLQQPLSEVRAYLAAKYETRFEIHPRLFEETVASVFADLGYQTRVTAYSGDDGIDVILDGANNELVGVQVKRYAGSISVEQIRALTGALLIGGYTRGIFVTTSSFQSGGERTAGLSASLGLAI